MRKLILVIFLVGFGRVFAAFEIDILGQLTASMSFPIQQVKTAKIKGSTEAIFGASLQIGNQFSMANSLKGISVLADIRIEQESIAITLPGETKNVRKTTGLNAGLGLTTKFIFGSVNSLVPRDTIIGFGVGAKVLANVTLSTSIPAITPFIDVFVEQRFFVSRKLALVGGIHVGADMTLYQSTDVGILFNGMYISAYPSFNIGLCIGLHFGH